MKKVTEVLCERCDIPMIAGGPNEPAPCPQCGKWVCFDCREHERGWCIECEEKKMKRNPAEFIESFKPKYGARLYKVMVPGVGTQFFQTMKEAERFADNASAFLKESRRIARLEEKHTYGGNPSDKIQYVTPATAKRLAGPMYFKLRSGFLAVGTSGGRSFRLGYKAPQGYYIEWDIATADEGPAETFERPVTRVRRLQGETDEEIGARVKELESITGAPVELENPRHRKIYQRIHKIYASKAGMPHKCDDECRRHGHQYVHAFKESACIYGLPDGSLLVK